MTFWTNTPHRITTHGIIVLLILSILSIIDEVKVNRGQTMTSLNLCANPDLMITSILVSREDKNILSRNNINISKMSRKLMRNYIKENGLV